MSTDIDRASGLLARLAEAKHLTNEFLRELRIVESPPETLRIPYLDANGTLFRTRLRTALQAKDGSKWDSDGQGLLPYGLWRLEEARQARFLVLVEGESDCWALWHHGFPALGLPGATTASCLPPEALESLNEVFIHQEPDLAGEGFIKGVTDRLRELRFPGEVNVFCMPDGIKDPADLHVSDPERFKERIRQAITQSARVDLKDDQREEKILFPAGPVNCSHPGRPDALDRARLYLRQCPPAISGQRGHDKTFGVVCKALRGFGITDEEQALRLLQDEWNCRCEPPWPEKDLRHKIKDAWVRGTDEIGGLLQQSSRGTPMSNKTAGLMPAGTQDRPYLVNLVSSSPDRPADAAFHGLAGDLVRLVSPHSEADPVAILAQILAAFGNWIGRTAHWCVERDTHHLNLFIALVGESSKSRKTSSWGYVRDVLAGADPVWASSRIKSGLNSGEGLIYHVRDATEEDQGVMDKRLLCHETEFASVLKVMGRQGNTLSALLRQFWDAQESIGSLTKNNPTRATGAHLSIIANITVEELHQCLTATDQANGFGNRFLWFFVKRAQKLPFGGNLDQQILDPFKDRFREAFTFAQTVGRIDFDEAGAEAWKQAYELLGESQPGLVGSLLARGEAQVRRIACLYAVLDRSPVVRKEHLDAALALWDYCERSVRCIFSRSTGNPDADRVLEHLRPTRMECRAMTSWICSAATGPRIRSTRFSSFSGGPTWLMRHRFRRMGVRRGSGSPANGQTRKREKRDKPPTQGEPIMTGSHPTTTDQLLSIQDVAARFRVSTRTIRRWLALGRFPQPVRFNRKVLRFRISDIAHFLDSHQAR